MTPHYDGRAIVGLEKIAALFGRSRWSVARWIRSEGFPAARLPDGTWFTTPSLIDAWVALAKLGIPVNAGDVIDLEALPNGEDGAGS